MNGIPGPAVCVGWLRHRRTAPVGHTFTYPLFMVLLDVDRIAELMAVSRFTGYNRWNWASFHESDHFGDHSAPLRQRLARAAADRGIALPDGPIYLLTHLRYLGLCFNPVSFFYCHDRTGTLRLILAEVNNTFGGTHNYWLAPDAAVGPRPVSTSAHQPQTTTVFRATASKAFHVSPFMPADMHYAFAFSQSGSRLVAHMALARSSAGEVPHAFDATLSLARVPWTGDAIARALLRHPLMTATVVGGIHWEALRLWWKGLAVVPQAAAVDVSIQVAVPPVRGGVE
ncbi:MAG TPA: DUF1365 domain-containing protein [Vicinamibacterales bacterium]|nr:DUF1365 domain-containing protein [Vicinamibacterales bacterium]